jgi:very-short-patch-repair endonuclease
MTSTLGRVCNLAEEQHGAVAVWQLRTELRLSRAEIVAATRRLEPVFNGVYAVGELTVLGWYRAATLALGPAAALSHTSAVHLLGLRPYQPGQIHVSVPRVGGRRKREGIQVHRSRQMDVGTCRGIPCTSPSQSLRDADLGPFELYRALEEAEDHQPLTLPPNDVVRLHAQVRGRTRSDAEAAALVLMAQAGVTLPKVNHHVNGIEADFHWPEPKLILEVDGYEFHEERAQFEEDRRRELVHAAAGWQVVRASAKQVMREPALVLAALGVRP